VRGAFISFEGIEGTGKSTQAALLARALEDRGLKALLTAEPGGTAIGSRIREVLLCVEHGAMDPVTELLLYAASRRQHLAELIMPALDEGRVVITDRFSDSTSAYQGYGRGLDLGLIDTLDRAVTGGLKPGLTILLDVDVETGLRRNRHINKVDRLELEDVAFHEKVRAGYRAIREAEPRRVKLLDASATAEEVHHAVMGLVEGFLRETGIASSGPAGRRG
jgi:dTMP kinase